MRAQALRKARSRDDHLAGKLGTALMAAMIEQGWLVGGNGLFSNGGADLVAAPGYDASTTASPRPAVARSGGSALTPTSCQADGS